MIRMRAAQLRVLLAEAVRVPETTPLAARAGWRIALASGAITLLLDLVVSFVASPALAVAGLAFMAVSAFALGWTVTAVAAQRLRERIAASRPRPRSRLPRRDLSPWLSSMPGSILAPGMTAAGTVLLAWPHLAPALTGTVLLAGGLLNAAVTAANGFHVRRLSWAASRSVLMDAVRSLEPARAWFNEDSRTVVVVTVSGLPWLRTVTVWTIAEHDYGSTQPRVPARAFILRPWQVSTEQVLGAGVKHPSGLVLYKYEPSARWLARLRARRAAARAGLLYASGGRIAALACVVEDAEPLA